MLPSCAAPDGGQTWHKGRGGPRDFRLSGRSAANSRPRSRSSACRSLPSGRSCSLPLFEKARIEIYLPDVPRQAYQNLLAALEQEFSYTFGGCTTVRGLEGNYLSQLGLRIRDRINLVYSDAPFAFEENFDLLSRYADEIRHASVEALEEEAVVVAV